MRKLLLLAISIAATTMSYAQALDYEDLAILFSRDQLNGTARFNAMSGAFGALGGDVSAISVNPAGGAVFKNSILSVTGSSRVTDINGKYYGNSILTQNEFFNVSQAGAALVFDSSSSSDWNRFAITLNYTLLNDFDNHFLLEGNGNIATFKEFPFDTKNPKTQYSNAEQQRFSNDYKGEINQYSFGFSGAYQRKLYVGAALHSYDLRFIQRAILSERNNDGNGNVLTADLFQENITAGTGFALSAGFIYRAHPFFRFGLSYQSPTWYTEMRKETNYTDEFRDEGREIIRISNDNRVHRYTPPYEELLYKLKTPSKLTASGAFLFGKHGLISIDYTRKEYQKIKLSGANFSDVNQKFIDFYRNTYAVNVGTEWRLDRFSIRGGYRFEQSPDKNAIDSDNLKGYSFGGGYNFGNIKVDLAYSDRNKTAIYNPYPQVNNSRPADLKIDNRIFTASVTIDL